jgi:hypothetical protein
VSPDLAGLTIAAASKELAARRLSAVELVEGILATIDRDNERLNAYLYVDREGALAAARRAEAALDDGSAGPLASIPTPAARFGYRRPCADWSRFALPMAWCLRPGSSRSPGPTTPWGRWRGPSATRRCCWR